MPIISLVQWTRRNGTSGLLSVHYFTLWENQVVTIQKSNETTSVSHCDSGAAGMLLRLRGCPGLVVLLGDILGAGKHCPKKTQ